MMKISFVVLSLAIAQSVNGLTTSGKCPEVKLPPEFDWEAYTGVWYQREGYPASFEVGTRCGSDEYSLSGGVGDIAITHFGINSTEDTYFFVIAFAKVLAPGQFEIVIDTSNQKDLKVVYNVLDTDYESYAVMYSCDETRLKDTEQAWIFTRDQTASQEVIAKGRQVMVNYGLPLAPLVITNQTDCPEWDREKGY